MRFFGCRKTAKMSNFLLKGDLRRERLTLEPLTVPHPFIAVFIGASTVCPVLSVIGLPQIGEVIVTRISIAMVYLFCRPVPGSIEPRQPMFGVVPAIDFEIPVPCAVQIPRALTYPYFPSGRGPVEVSGRWVVRHDATEFFVRDHARILPGAE
jgi:hypothetical protein